MSEDSVKINGVVQVGLDLIIGAVYIGIIYAIVISFQTEILTIPLVETITRYLAGNLTQHDHQTTTIMLIAGLVFFGVISGMLIVDFIKKFTFVSPILLAVVTVLTVAPIKILIEGLPQQS